MAAQDVLPAGPPGGIYADALFTRERGQSTIFLPCAGTIRPMGRVAATVIPAAEEQWRTEVGWPIFRTGPGSERGAGHSPPTAGGSARPGGLDPPATGASRVDNGQPDTAGGRSPPHPEAKEQKRCPT
jgi:hypothetical protein